MTRTIIIEVRQNYGALAYYPDCKDSKLFMDMLKQKTLTPRDLAIIQELGYEISYTGGVVPEGMRRVAEMAKNRAQKGGERRAL